MADRLLRGASIRNTNVFLWNDPVVLFNTANQDPSTSVMENEGTLGSIWDLVVFNSGSTYWARKQKNWSTQADIGSTFPSDWDDFIGGAPSTNVIVNLNITGPDYDGANFTEVEFISDQNGLDPNSLEYFHTFFMNNENYFEVDTYAAPSFPLYCLVDNEDWQFEESLTPNYGHLMYGVAVDVVNGIQKAWIYDATHGMFSYTNTLTGFVSPAEATYMDFNNTIGSGYTTREATYYNVYEFFAYIGDNESIAPVGTPWDGTYIAGIWRPTAIPTDAQIMALYNHYLGLL